MSKRNVTLLVLVLAGALVIRGDEVVSAKAADPPTVASRRIAVFIIDFPDTPQQIKDRHFPSISALRDIIFAGQISAYFSDMSYGQFTLTGDVFGYFTHQNPGFVNGAVTEEVDVLDITTIDIPDFDIDRYDGVAFVSINDAGLAGGRGGVPPFLVNGKTYTKPGVFVPIHIGHFLRDSSNYPQLSDSTREREPYIIPIGTDQGLEGVTTMPLSRFDRTFAHELIHYLDLGHATSRTNGTSFDYEPEVPNNNCKCYSDPLLGSLLNRDYGNMFDVMGFSEYGVSLNSVFRDRLGWTDASSKHSMKDYGHAYVTIKPVNSTSGIRMAEIRVPGSGNKGYFLEVRTAASRWDNMLAHVQLRNNRDGIMVLKTDGFGSQLLDMSPSANIEFYGQVVPDIRDVVLKPGMVYENDEIRLSGVQKNNDGSFSLDVYVVPPPRRRAVRH